MEWSGVGAEVLAIADQVEDPEPLTEQDRATIRARVGLREFFERLVEPGLMARVATGRIKPATAAKYRQQLNRWEDLTRPDNWVGRSWPGLPVGSITTRHVETWLDRLQASTSRATAYSAWQSLRVIFSAARNLGIIDRIPQPFTRNISSKESTVVWTDDELERGFVALSASLALQVGWVVANNCGMRARELWLLRWDDVDLGRDPSISYRAEKTRKAQRIPLAELTRAAIDRLPRLSEYVFPECSSPGSLDPERSKQARRRRAIFSALLSSAGLDASKPCQVCRATCNTRLNRVSPGAGDFVLGHSASSVNAKNYTEPTGIVFDAVRAVRQPELWTKAILNGGGKNARIDSQET